MVDVKKAAIQLSQLALLKYFPQDEYAQDALVHIVCVAAKNNDQIDWLVWRVLTTYDEWPGPRVIRELFDHPLMPGNMKPLSEADRLKVLGSDQKLLGDGVLPSGEVTADPNIQTAFELLRATQALKERGWDRPATPEEIASAPEWLRKLEGYE